MAYGMASLSFGGQTVKSMPHWALSAGDFELTDEEGFDKFTPTADNKLEPRPRDLTLWFRAAIRQCWAFACIFGEEHYPALEAAASQLLEMGEKHSYAWPAQRVYDTWEELWARFMEELRQLDRKLLREMNEPSPTFERIKFFCLAPDANGEPWLRLPGVWRLSCDDEYFQTDVIPRCNREMSRQCWKLVNGPSGRKAGEDQDAKEDDGKGKGKGKKGKARRAGDADSPPW
jgi:hypothetical protein